MNAPPDKLAGKSAEKSDDESDEGFAEASTPDRPSKSQRKRDMAALQALGAELVALAPERLRRVELPDELREAIGQAGRITAHEGRRRQLQYVGKLMRGVDPAPIRAALDAFAGKSRAATELLHRCERWRERLLADDAALTEWLAAHPAQDAQRLRALIRAARRERAAGNPPRNARELYQWLHDTLGKDRA
jgi:ribosome-associated protein